jgi:hypothetical protein
MQVNGRNLRGYVKTYYINQNETQEPLEPRINSDRRIQQRFFSVLMCWHARKELNRLIKGSNPYQ